MAIPHASSAQAIDVQPLGKKLAQAQTVALIKTNDMEVVRMILLAGKIVPPHKVPGEITIQCLEGQIECIADGHIQTLNAGQLLYLSGGVQHSLAGVEDASILVTILLRK